MHTSTISDQTDHTEPDPLARYDGADSDEYLSNSDSYNDNDSDCGLDDYNNYESNCESDSEEAPCASSSTTETSLVQLPNVQEQKTNATYTLREEKFNTDFTPKDQLNSIRRILLSPPRDMLNDKGSLDCLPIYLFLFPNKKCTSLYNAYDYNEVEDKLVIKIDQDDRAPKFSVADDIAEVYGLPGIHEYINGQTLLRAVIDIDASQEDMETTGVKAQEVFVRICCSFIRALYRILDCGWKDILKELVIATSSDPSKCSYHILYVPALLIDHHELKAFTDLVYTLTGEKFDNGWNELDHVRVQPPFNLGLEVRPRLLSEKKNNNPLKMIVDQDILQKCADLVLQKHFKYLRNWTIEEKDSQSFVYFNRKALLECPLCKCIHDKDQRWFGHVCANNGMFVVKCFHQNSNEPGEIFEYDLSIAEKILQKNKILLQPFHKVKGPGFPRAFVKIPSWVKYSETLTATETYKERYVRQLPNEGDIYVGSSWETGKTYVLENLVILDDINLLLLFTRHSYSNAVTTRLNLKSYCDIDGNINLPDQKRVVCQIESLYRITNNCKCNKKCKCRPSQYDLWLDEIVSIIAQAQSHLAEQLIEKLYKLIQKARRIIVMDNDLTDLNIEWIKPLRKDRPFAIIHNTYQPQNGKTFRLVPNKETVKDVQGIVRALKTDFSELRIKEYYSKSDSVEKAHDFSNFEQAFCIFNSYIETNAGTNQMLFRMRCIKDYICHIKQRSSNVPITENGLFRWLLNAKRECLSQELQKRGIFPDINSIIRNKDVPTIQLWVGYMLEKFRSRRLFGWRMVDFLREAGMVISIIEPIPKYDKNVTSLSQVVKVNSATVKAEEISAITNATIVNYETAEFLENKLKKTLEEIRSLDRHHIADCYGISPELLTEEFISKYGNYNHMKWFRAYKQLRDAGIDNEMAIEAITPRNIDNRVRYKADDVKMCINSPEAISYLQDLVPRMARVFNNTDALRRAKKSGLKTI
ncbi:hypothetical protein C2G38_2226291 [Gigaspora rosea]|uniref:Replication origin-binding protein domain-containing protein n=1 Tax=Gigaspora rosea TaxID=44941 RepID=A0A397U6N8_9GLOM|nr:hypothetical protein C2G38_2226291 [Gigaspora rosea]